MNDSIKINRSRRRALLSGGASVAMGAALFPKEGEAKTFKVLHAKQQLRELGKPSYTTVVNGVYPSIWCDRVKWYWDPESIDDDDGVRYLLPRGHAGAGRYVLDGDVTYKSFNIFDDLSQDSSDGIKDYWNYCIDHNLPFVLGPITVLVTKNNIFGQFGSRAVRGKVIQGVGRGETKVVFKPKSKTRCFLYDGGDDSEHNPSILLNQTFRDLTIHLDTSNCPSVGVYRLYGNTELGASNQNFEFHYCTVTGKGALAETFFYQLMGTANTSENKNLFCEINYLTHVCLLNNPQGVDQAFIECDVWLIKSHFFVVDKGALEIRITGGSWIWDDDKNGGHVPQYLFYISDSTGVGKGNLTSIVTAFKPEMRNKGACLVYAPSSLGSVFINFISCNFLGGGIESARSMLILNQNKRVTFDNCAIPSAMGVAFVNILSSTYNTYDVTGLVLFTACGFEQDISKNIIHDSSFEKTMAKGLVKMSSGGRVIADELCHGVIGESGGIQEKIAFSFDTNPYDSGKGMPGYSIKRLPMKASKEPWPWKQGADLLVVLPHNAKIVGFKIYKPPTSSLSTMEYKLNVGNGDKSKIYRFSEGKDGGGFIIDWELPLNKQIICNNENTRRVRVWEESGGFATYSDIQGVCDVIYI